MAGLRITREKLHGDRNYAILRGPVEIQQDTLPDSLPRAAEKLNERDGPGFQPTLLWKQSLGFFRCSRPVARSSAILRNLNLPLDRVRRRLAMVRSFFEGDSAGAA